MKTIGEHFAALNVHGDLREALDLITYEQYTTGATHKLYDYQSWDHLLELCAGVIHEWQDLPYLGPPTHERIMDFAMKRLYKRHSVYAPPPWLPIIRALHDMPALKESKSEPELPPAEELGITPAPQEVKADSPAQPTQGAKYDREESDRRVREAFGLPPDHKFPKE